MDGAMTVPLITFLMMVGVVASVKVAAYFELLEGAGERLVDRVFEWFGVERQADVVFCENPDCPECYPPSHPYYT